MEQIQQQRFSLKDSLARLMAQVSKDLKRLLILAEDFR